MAKKWRKSSLSLGTKVLVPVVSAMVLLLGITLWMVNHRIRRQFEDEATRSLATAQAVFQNSLKLHARNLLLRFRNLPKEPRYKSIFQIADAPTLRDFFNDLLAEQDLHVVLFTTVQGETLVSASRDPLMPLSQFESASGMAIRKALAGEETADTIRAGDRLFDLVSIPVRGTGDYLIGCLTLGSEVGNDSAQDLRDATQCQIVLLASRHVIASSVPGPQLHEQFAKIFSEAAPVAAKPFAYGAMQRIVLGDEHYFCLTGRFPTLKGDSELGYLLLSSYEQPLRALKDEQQKILLASVLAILVGSAMVGFLVRKVTQPLRALRDSAEAVGQGDFTRRVEVASEDECGELASVFNRMTANLRQSREQLELTVDTLKTTQAHLIQSEKLSGIGEFVAGVAHELNNPLTSVIGFSELLRQADNNPQHQRYMEMIYKSSLRCQKIVQSLLSFARRHQPERKLSNVNELVEAAVEILQYQMRTGNIEVITRLAPDLPKAMLDPHQIQQVFLNIINNARQAIEMHQPSGQVRISTESAGHHVRVVFQDTGPGIPQENLSKVFDPFFTTKEVGKGTGLGLSLCYGIIKEHGGAITVRSRPGEGATFVVDLPLAQQPSEPPATEPAAPVPSSDKNEGAGKRVLVIDDEDAILEMMRHALTEQGYQVDVAQDGESALRRLEQQKYDLALCDWKMPGLSGQQVYERLRAANPAMSERMIFITGDVVNETTSRFLQDRQRICLRKPFSLSDFRAAISRALNGGLDHPNIN